MLPTPVLCPLEFHGLYGVANSRTRLRDFHFHFAFNAIVCVDHKKRWKILHEMEIPDHLTCLLRNLYAGQEAAARTGRGTTDWFQEKEYV